MKMLITVLTLVSLVAMADHHGEKKWTHESKLSSVSQSGNTIAETWAFATKHAYKMGMNSFTLSGHYNYGSTGEEASKVLAARNWDYKLRYDRFFTDRITGFISYQTEGDRFQGFDERTNIDLGAKYVLHNSDEMKTHFELGIRQTTEDEITNGSPVNVIDTIENKYTKVRLYGEHSRPINSNVDFKLWAEYLPSVNTDLGVGSNTVDENDFILTVQPSLNVKLNTMLTFQTAYTYRYDSVVPASTKKVDGMWTNSLVARF